MILTKIQARSVKTTRYVKASRYLEQMEKLGIVSPLNEKHQKTVLITTDEWEKMLEEIEKSKK